MLFHSPPAPVPRGLRFSSSFANQPPKSQVMKRRPLRAAGSFGLYALCICLSTIALQALTYPSPTPFLSRLNPVLWSSSNEIKALDLRLQNLSVHRVRYVNEDAQEDQNQMQAAQLSSVVVTWEDHPLAARARAKDERLEEEKEIEDAVLEGSESFSYEVQIWVTGWGLDGLWNVANRKVSTTDPFFVLGDLPREHEMGFRVRMKAKQTKRSLLGYLLPMGFFSTETNGPWSDVATLSPTRDDELQAIVTFLASNKPLLLLLAVCIGSGCLVVAQLYFRRRLAMGRQRKLLKMQSSRRSSSDKDIASANEDEADTDSGKSTHQLEREIRDLRQELADSEDEVRQLMLFSGYGIDSLAPHELEQLDRELKHTLQRIHHLKKHPAPESGHPKLVRHKQRDALPMSPIYEHRSF